MNFITFPASATNIFPAANSTTGSQLVTEWNIRARETVGTDPDINYPIGPSFTHGMEDFEVSILADSGGVYVNTYTLQISEGRAVINGHYVQTLVPMTIDLIEANAKLKSESKAILKGDLAIGIRTFYSTDQTISGSILVENEEDMFLGVQLVVLPESEFITPIESPNDSSKVTADLRLATFSFVNNTIVGLKNSEDKIKSLDSKRISGLDDWISDRYVTKIGLNPKKIYSFAGKGSNPATGYDTWEDTTDSLMVWDYDPKRTLEKPTYKEAQIVTTKNSSFLVIPHKQVSGMTDDDGNSEYYASKTLEFPVANYNEDTPGIVNKEYTRQIKDIDNKVNTFRSTLTGKQIYFMEYKQEGDTLPVINNAWAIGDYILVQNDVSAEGSESDEAGPPATKYVVLPGQVKTLEYITKVHGDLQDNADIPENIIGYELGSLEWYESAGQSTPDISDPQYYPVFYGEEDVLRAVPYSSATGKWNDYFRVRYYLKEEEEEGVELLHPYDDYYYGVKTSGAREWSGPIVLTGQVPFAGEDVIGGFLNASEDAVDAGYVRLDDTGHLVLTDYAILRSGTLAYQISSDTSVTGLSDLTSIQEYLDNWVNDRVAFPTTPNQSAIPSILNIYLDIPELEEEGSLEIHGIDSRFNTAVCLHIRGLAKTTLTINIYDCEKLIIDNEIGGQPVINVLRTCLYYDPIIFNYIRTCTRDTSIYGDFTGFKDLSIWYAQRDTDDVALSVSGMTVSELDSQIISSDINYWKELGTAANDNNYLVALKSITFSSEGTIVGCEVLTANNSTDNVEPGNKVVVGDFVLPQGSSLIYPIACLTRVLKVTGTFTSAYYSDGYWYVTDNSFTLETGTYDPYDFTDSMTGTIAFHSITTLVQSTVSQTSIKPWEADTYHMFRGGAIS